MCFSVCITATRTFCPLLSGCFSFNLTLTSIILLFPFLQALITTRLDPRPLHAFPSIPVLRLCITNTRMFGHSSLLLCSYNLALTSIPANLSPFLHPPIFTPFGLRPLLVFFAVFYPSGFSSQIHTGLIIQCLFFMHAQSYIDMNPDLSPFSAD